MERSILKIDVKAIKNIPITYKKELITSEDLALYSINDWMDIKYIPTRFKTEKVMNAYFHILSNEIKTNNFLEELEYIPWSYYVNIVTFLMNVTIQTTFQCIY